ncbi:MAG: energy transducer TonB [Rhodothermales bacterium]
MLARLTPILLLLCIALPARAQDDDLLNYVENPPQLVGGLEGLQQEIHYPEAAKADGIEGTVFVQFVVDETGNVIDEKILRSLGPEIDAEALRVVRQARFEPGTQRGEPVKVRFSLPIKFKLGPDRSDG